MRMFSLAACMAVALSACDSASEDTGSSTEHDLGVAAPGVIQYRLEWDQTNVTRIDSGWEVLTDLGYRVQVNWGYVVTYSVSLVPCPMASNSLPLQLFDWFVPTAFAGHGDIADQSAIETSIGESLQGFSATTVVRSDMADAEYCDAFILFARGDLGTTTSESGVDLDGISVTLSGQWFAPESDTPTEFSVETDLARGELQSSFDDSAATLMNNPLQIGPDVPGVRIRFVRSVATLFDGIDFTTALDRTIARGILRNLAQKTTVFQN